MQQDARISHELPEVPHSLRSFIERASKDERVMNCLAEDPVRTIHRAGIPVRKRIKIWFLVLRRGLTTRDLTRFVTVVGRLHDLVASGNIAKDFRFEDVFEAGGALYRAVRTESRSHSRTSFTPKTESWTYRHTNRGTNTKWNGDDILRGLDDRWLTAPLISPRDLATIVTRIDAQIDAMAES